MPTPEGGSSLPLGATVAIAPGARTDVYRRISGPLVNAMVTGALSAPASENHSAFIKQVILALISIPIWLMIVLLSPLDAYAAVKDLARQV
jgi:surface polysaccharide O-acyltransferase-like enzyme